MLVGVPSDRHRLTSCVLSIMSQRRRKQRPTSAVVQRRDRSAGQKQQYSSAGGAMDGFTPVTAYQEGINRQRPNSAGRARRRTAKSHTVVLDGQPLSGIDPDNFSDFYRERQEQKRIEASRSRSAASSVRKSNRRRPRSAAPGYGNTGGSTGSASRDDLHYPTANNRRRDKGRGRPVSAPGGKRGVRPGSAQANLLRKRSQKNR